VNAALFLAAWEALAADCEVWGFVQDVTAGVLVLAVSEQIAEAVLAWELGGQVIP
jgi:hypothetical protein